MSFTDDVRQELSRIEVASEAEGRAELSALLHVAGTLHLAGGAAGPQLDLHVATTSGACARRVFRLLGDMYELRPELRVRAAGGVRRRTSYEVVLGDRTAVVARDLGLLDRAGRPRRLPPPALVDAPPLALAYVRGAVLGAGSISAPGRSPHLEVRVADGDFARALAQLVEQATGVRAGTSSTDAGARVVVKSGTGIGELLTAIGAIRAFLRWDDRRLRRDLRNEANRLANADAANVRRTVEAAAEQVRLVERVVGEIGWERVPDDLRDVALARLANPSASLSEIGELCDPPVGKATVHRRLQRLADLTEGRPSDGST